MGGQTPLTTQLLVMGLSRITKNAEGTSVAYTELIVEVTFAHTSWEQNSYLRQYIDAQYACGFIDSCLQSQDRGLDDIDLIRGYKNLHHVSLGGFRLS